MQAIFSRTRKTFHEHVHVKLTGLGYARGGHNRCI